MVDGATVAPSLVSLPAGVPAQHCVLGPKHQKLGVLRAVAARKPDITRLG